MSKLAIHRDFGEPDRDTLEALLGQADETFVAPVAEPLVEGRDFGSLKLRYVGDELVEIDGVKREKII